VRSGLFYIGLCGLLGLSGCAGGLTTRFNPAKFNPEKFSENIRRDFQSITHFNGRATITLDSPEQSGRISSQITIIPDDHTVVDFRTPFGGVVGTLEFTKDMAVFINAKDELQYIGDPKGAGIPGLPQIIRGKQDLQRILLGLINLPVNLDSQLQKEGMDGTLYRLVYQIPEAKVQYWVDPRTKHIIKYEEYNRHSGERTSIDLANFIQIKGIRFPRSITITQLDQKRLFSVYYHKIEITRRKYSG